MRLFWEKGKEPWQDQQVFKKVNSKVNIYSIISKSQKMHSILEIHFKKDQNMTHYCVKAKYNKHQSIALETPFYDSCCNLSTVSKNVKTLPTLYSASSSVFQLSESCLSFSDLAQLVFFYSLSRDVLALCLKIPRWISNVAELTKDCLSQLQPSLVRAKSEETPPSSSMSATQGGVVLRRSSQSSTSSLSNRGSTGSLPPSTTELQNRGSPGPQSPHRVSWIEDGFWLPPPTRPSSSLHPPSPELDSLSISSIEEEQEHRPPSPMSHHPSAHRLADKVINRLSAVGQALGSLVCQKRRLTNRVLELSDRKRGPFATAVKEFVEVTLQRGTDPGGFTGSEFLQEVRSLLTSLRETLLDYPDIQALLDSMTDLSDSEIDPLVEISVHKVALKPVSAHLYSCIHIWRTNDGILQRLEHNQHVLEDNGVEALGGASGVGVPDSVTLERIQQRWTSMHEAYSPNKKVHILLKVCKSIYHSMSANASSDVVLGADDFLPCLTWVLLRSELLSLQIDTDYMMELLDPTQLQGEGGYYLTTLYAALYYISSFQPRLAARQLSVEAQHSLSQWHRRRTLHSNQSRHSKRRQTIRRHACPEKAVQVGEEDTGEVGGSVMEEQQTEMNTDEMVDSEQAGWAGR
ncbi:ras and Rab interactor 3 isoform X4 [Dunckerocampus dactyliophorus]|uniref:ras and Rab interactor 3 isoform X4 n=1 Tax=Dunckerocampus dactyliophorus TaxID=161453 RepID=UPI00240553AD|nr:ras and Rab interactor 3 isoform X4 [Dunckerocampus dactyliophorus]